MRTQRVMSWSLSFKLTTSRFMIQEQYSDHFISLWCGVKSFYICFHSNNDCPIKNSNLLKQTNLNISGDSDKWLQLNINDFRWWKIREILKLVSLSEAQTSPAIRWHTSESEAQFWVNHVYLMKKNVSESCQRRIFLKLNCQRSPK